MKPRMNCNNTIILVCVLTLALDQVALADTEENSEEVEVGEGVKISYNESSVDLGPADSHEAMNNRDVHLSTRNKRGYEFLIGLINNNSKYETTRTDSPRKSLRISQDDDSNATASEMLLELLVKIAAHPDHWSKVHKLLENINNDLATSKKIVEDMQKAKVKTEPVTDKTSIVSLEKKESGVTKNNTDNYLMNNEWPTFQDQLEMNNKMAFVNTASPEGFRLKNYQHKMNYPKTFAYHRVTGRPMFLNKNPKAYIAVSVIAPKPMNSRSKEEDLILEKELRQLKPWTHKQNLKNMASIRSRWIIQRDEKTDSP